MLMSFLSPRVVFFSFLVCICYSSSSLAQVLSPAVPAENKIDTPAVPAENKIDTPAVPAETKIGTLAVPAEKTIDTNAFIVPSKENQNIPKDLTTPLPASSTSPPPGALVVGKHAQNGEFSTIAAALEALELNVTARNNNLTQTIFIYPGNYTEHLVVTHFGPLRMIGYTQRKGNYNGNRVNIMGSLVASVAGSNQLSATLSIIKDDFAMYYINVYNTYGRQGKYNQAIAVSGTGSKQAYYACKFIGYQDTLLTLQGYHYYSKCYIEGAVDYVFTQEAVVWFEKVTLASVAKGAITANGRATATGLSKYVFNRASVISVGAPPQSTFLGRPWGNYSKTAFQNSYLSDVLNPLGWSPWSKMDARTNHTTYEEFNNSGPGAVIPDDPSTCGDDDLASAADTTRLDISPVGVKQSARATFCKQLKKPYKVKDILGAQYHLWIDPDFPVTD